MTPWCTKIAITRSILKLQDSSFACNPDFTKRKIIFWELGRRRIFQTPSFFRGPRRKEVGGKEAAFDNPTKFKNTLFPIANK